MTGTRARHVLFSSVMLVVLLAFFQLLAQRPAEPAKTAPAKAAPAKSSAAKGKGDPDAFHIHQFHAQQLSLDCSTCHVPEKEGSVMLQRPGHEQCMLCHAPAFGAELNQKICSQCHSAFPPTSSEDLRPFPLFKKQQAILFEFSHAKHVDTQARIDPRTGFRADCTFCHQFDTLGVYASFPRHTQCAACHSKPGMTPNLSATSTTADCRGCHTPEEIENPGFTEDRRLIAPHVASGTLVNIKFAHRPHFEVKDKFNLNCTTCHYAIPTSTSLANLTLPKMIDCVECHDNDRNMAPQFRMSNCSTCHVDNRQGVAPAGHTRYVKPAFHTESFRRNHSEEASSPGAKCFVCHNNMTPPPTAALFSSTTARNQCVSCHQVMAPASHTARWKDDVHGKFAALDRTSCAVCHTADSCSQCHNQLPSSHEPLALFKAGAHANLALLNERACLTCHTFQNTCALCHAKGFQR